MAEGLLRHFKGEYYEVYSAGTHPSFVNQHAIQSMAEIGIDISNQTSNSVNEYLSIDFDIVITVCNSAALLCPNTPGANSHYHWPFDDPYKVRGDREALLRKFAEVRDQIKERLLADL